MSFEAAESEESAIRTMRRRSSAVGLNRAVEKCLQLLLKVCEIDLDGFQGIRDLLKADVFVILGRPVEVELVTILLDDLAAVPEFVEAKSGRRSFEKMTKARQLLQILIFPAKTKILISSGPLLVDGSVANRARGVCRAPNP